MDIGTTAARYATALLAFAAENDEEKLVYQEMSQAAEAFQKLPQMHHLLQNPALPAKERNNLLTAACQREGKTSKTTQQFIKLLEKNGRTDMMPFFAQSYIERYRKKHKFIASQLTLSAPISPEAEQRFKALVEKLTSSQVEFQVEVDSQLKGGFVLQYDTYRLDASVRTQFNQLRRKLGK